MKLKYLCLPLIALAVSASALMAMPQQTKAVSAADWKAGRIIDDAVFFNKDSMSVQQIQDFLNAKVPGCDRWNPTRFTYAGKPYGPPYTCLKEYQENPTTKENNIGRFNPDGSPYNVPGGWSAAQIIKDASNSYGINPQVLIVMLQKETAIVTDTWAAGWQYDRAMGYGCPDNGPNNTANCSASYYGFYNQVGNAAWQLKRYTTNPNEYNFKAGVTRNILWQVGGVCGSSPVYLENAATAALYNYTPYQPNQAALTNLYGTGDGCSAYGNRNFWRIFNDWFGSGQIPDFEWSLVTQQLFMDNTKTTSSSSQLGLSTKAYAVIKIKNDGAKTWFNSGPNPVRLGTSRPNERNSVFCDKTWLSCARPANLLESTVAPGQTGTFEFWLNPPFNGGSFTEYFTPLAEGDRWFKDIGLFYNIGVQQPNYSWQLTSQYAFTDQTKTTIKNMANLNPGEKVYVGFTAKNTGNLTWKNDGTNPVRVGTVSPIERSSLFSNGSGWLGSSRAANMKEAVVAPGQTGTFEFWMTAPTNAGGIYHERLGLVMEGVRWMNDVGLSFYAGVQQPNYSWQLTSQYAFTDQTKTTIKNMANLNPGEKVYVGFTAKNTGNLTWKNDGTNPVRVGTVSPIERSSLFSNGSGWLGSSRAANMKEAVVAPGQTGTFEFWMTAPTNAGGIYHERLGLVMEGVRWMNDVGLSFYAGVL
jgi:hypothetical protein